MIVSEWCFSLAVCHISTGYTLNFFIQENTSRTFQTQPMTQLTLNTAIKN